MQLDEKSFVLKLTYSYIRSYYVHKFYCALDKVLYHYSQSPLHIMQVKSLHKQLIH